MSASCVGQAGGTSGYFRSDAGLFDASTWGFEPPLWTQWGPPSWSGTSDRFGLSTTTYGVNAFEMDHQLVCSTELLLRHGFTVFFPAFRFHFPVAVNRNLDSEGLG